MKILKKNLLLSISKNTHQISSFILHSSFFENKTPNFKKRSMDNTSSMIP